MSRGDVPKAPKFELGSRARIVYTFTPGGAEYESPMEAAMVWAAWKVEDEEPDLIRRDRYAKAQVIALQKLQTLEPDPGLPVLRLRCTANAQRVMPSEARAALPCLGARIVDLDLGFPESWPGERAAIQSLAEKLKRLQGLGDEGEG